MKVCVVGLGQVGLPTALYIAERGFDVRGYDISEKAVRNGKNIGIEATVNWDDIPTTDIYVICVSTSLIDKNPDITAVFDICRMIAKKAEPSSLVSIESTIVPGTCRKINVDIFEYSHSLIHVPHRYWAGDPERHGVKQTRVIGAVDTESLEKGLNFYKRQLDIPLHIVPFIEIAEMSKIAENAYRYLQIAFAEELSMMCEQLGFDFQDVRTACNTKWNTKILEARDGIKGHCLPKDIRYLASLSKNSLLESAIFVDNVYQQWLTQRKSVRVLASK